MAQLLGAAPGETTTLRERIEAGETVLAPGCYDALGARLVEEAGFPAAYMTGFGSSASRLGRPDVGLMSLPEMVDNARRIVQAVDIPVIADADTGYGNPINVIRTVREYEAAVAARRSPDFLIIARTDARAVEGLEASLERARLYAEAGADGLFVEAPQSEAEIEAVARAFPDVPLLFNYAEGGKTPAVKYDRLRSLGFSIVIFPLTLLFVATQAMRAALARVKADGTPIELLPSLLPFDEFVSFIGLPEMRELELRFAQE